MGGVLSDFFGTTNNFQAQNPYEGTKGQAAAELQEAINRDSAIYGNQQNLAEALQAQMQGQGPNPSQVQYMNNVGNNINNAQGLIASQRGLNPALAARLGANVATNENQKASLGSALLQQQQQLAAQDQLRALYGQMSQSNLGLQGALTGNANTAQNANAAIAGGNTATRAGIVGGILNAAGGIGGGLIARGGSPAAASTGAGTGAGMGSGGGAVGGASALNGSAATMTPAMAGIAQGGKIKGKANVEGDSPSNDTVPAMLSPGEIVIPRSKAQDPEKAKEFIDSLLKSEGKSDVTYADVLKAKRKNKK